MTGRSVFAFGFLLALAAPAAAQEPLPRVALVVETTGDPVARRLRAELVALGFEVVEVAAEGEAARDALETVARDQGAVAALRVVPSEQGVEVWIVDRVTGKTVLREVVTADATAPAEEVVPLRAVELLRASLMEIDAPHEVHGEVPPPPNLRTIVPKPRPPPLPPPRFSLALGPALLVSPGGLSTAGEARVAFRWRPFDRFGVSAVGLVPALAAYIETPQYRSDVSPWVIGAALDVYFARPGARWSPTAGLGIGFAALRMVGQGPQGAIDTTWGTAPFACAGLTYAVSRSLRVGADVLAGTLFPETVVEFQSAQGDNIRVASWGRPLAAWSVGLEVAW